jgi:hypothetical protein
MKLDITQVLYSYNGEPMASNAPHEKHVDLTLRFVLAEALAFNTKEETEQGSVTAEAMSKRYLLMTELHRKDEVEYTAEEIADLKMRVTGRFQRHIIIGAVALSLLDPVSDSALALQRAMEKADEAEAEEPTNGTGEKVPAKEAVPAT